MHSLTKLTAEQLSRKEMWFGESVKDAISRTRAENKLLLVFIEGPDDLSISCKESLESIQEKILTHSVPIKLTAGSQNAIAFSQFYPILVVPATYIVTPAGLAVEVIAGKVQVEDFVNKLEKAAEQLPPPSQQTSSSTTSTPVAHRSGAETPPSVPSPAMAGPPPPSPASPAQPALDDKLALAQRKLEELKARKEKEDEERERQLELERRETGKAVLSAKKRREEQEMLEAANERKRDAALEREHRARVLAQIEQDKEERRKRFSKQQDPETSAAVDASPQQQQAVTPPKVNSDEAKIQFRFPDGHTLTHVFKSSDKLQSAHDFVASSESLSKFKLAQMYPRKTFVDQDMSNSFSELGLVPTSVLLVMIQSSASSYIRSQSNKQSTSASSSVVQGSYFTDFIPWFIMMPLMTLWNFITSFLPNAAVPDEPQSSTSGAASSSTSPPARNITSTSAQPSTSGVRRRDLPSNSGNIHRLRDEDDDDDEKKKTWNGNSTQQM